MKTKNKENNPKKHQQNSKNIQILDLTEVNDKEAELVVGGVFIWGSSLGGGSGGGTPGS
ncbi:hypothetical protein NIES2100_17380 [Calothrix sp. NIES-2100]|uniref:hypothetical protein n=1 Tax=Calothrix sp. NIES-2100 TaxID=1954172 RepID=UPI000B5E4791|nr:hypothetical protein NIES2100_17380 [Calothrix sp. NIES-2100]